MERKVLAKEFYTSDDVLMISRHLIGKYLCTSFDGVLTTGKIVETEAYRAPEDRASHAWNGRRTARNSIMYEEGGVCYVYKCYGIHSMFNVVTNSEHIPHAILIRAIEPCEGLEVMSRRRGMPPTDRQLTSGPGKLAQALGITTAHNGLTLLHPPIWIEDRDKTKSYDANIATSTRIGVDYAGEDALLPWRFYLKGNKWVSK